MYKRRVKHTPLRSPVVSQTSQDEVPKVVMKQTLDPPSKHVKPLKERKENSARAELPKYSSKSKKRIAEQSDDSDVGEVQLPKMLRVASEAKKVPYFEEVLNSCGFEVSHEDAHMLTCDQGIFLRDLKLKIDSSLSPSSMATGFLKSFEEYCEKVDNLKKCLQVTKSVDNGKSRKTTQDSLIHLLLSMNHLQKRLIEFLCEKLVLFVCSDDRDDTTSRDYPWTQMILRQFKFLDHIIDPDGFLTMLFDVLDSVPEKGDVLLSLPYIIQDSQHTDTARRLSQLLLQNSEMTAITPSILDALTFLTVPHEIQCSVSENVMKWLGAVPLEFLPNMVRFLVTNTHPEDMPNVISKFRRHLDFSATKASQTSTRDASRPKRSASDTSATAKSCVVLTVKELRLSVMTSRQTAEDWLSAIKAVSSGSEHRPIDIVMLLVIHAYVANTKTVVQALFRSKAKALIFREKLLNNTFSSMVEIIKEYRDTLMEILFSLLRSPDPAVVQHASCWYKLCLMHLPAWQGQGIVQRLVLHVGTGNMACMRSALQVLLALVADHLDCLLPHHRHLQILLYKIPDVDLEITEMVLEVLCRVAFGTDFRGGSTLDDNLLMLVRKQLGKWNPDMRMKGVIGAVLAAKHMSTKGKEQSESLNDTIKQAVQLMELVTSATSAYPDATGLFLDKLSTVLSKVEDMDENFLAWIIDFIGETFEQKYVSPVKELNLEDDLKLMMCLDDPNDADEDDVCVKIALLVDRDNLDRRTHLSNIVTMHSSLRLVRCVKYLACDGSLNDIAALLTCSVVMPCALEQEEGLDFSCPQEQNFLLDCLFHCVNWFREVVCAFAYQKSPQIRRAVMLRMKNIVNLESKLAEWLSQAIEYTPPPCQFYAVAKVPKPAKVKKIGKKKGLKRKRKSKKGKKKARPSDASEGAAEEAEEGEEEEEEEPEGETEGEGSSLEVSRGIRPVDLSEYRGFLRELDVDVLVLVMEPLQLSSTSELSHSGLSPAILLFLLKDFNAKVEHLLAPEAKRASALKAANVKPLGFHHLDTFLPRNFACNTIKMLSALCDKLETINKYCQNLLEESDNIRDAPSMFPENSVDIKLCYSYILSILAGLFRWSGFESKLNSDYLKDAFQAVLRQESTRNEPLPVLLRQVSMHLQGYSEHTLHLAGACALVRLLSALCRLSDDEAASENIAKTCKSFLSQRWFTLEGSEEKGTEFNRQVDFLIKELFNNVPKLRTVSNMVSRVHQELENFTKLGSKDWSLEAYPCITKSNFPLLFRAMSLALAQGTEELLELATGERSLFKVWEVAVECLRGLVMITRMQNSRSNLIAFVKNSLRFLKLFVKRGIPLCSRVFKNRSNDVTALLHNLQKSTRFLQSICYHSKATKDKTLTSQVPMLRLVLEQIVVEVRCMLSQNNCHNAFWVGILKNRNLQGEEVMSQESKKSESTEEEQEQEELPSDDDSDVDVDLDKPREDEEGEEEDAEELSVSEVF